MSPSLLRSDAMPKFLEKKLKARYGADSSIPYKIMNARGYMRGNKETKAGRAAQKKHEHDMRRGAAHEAALRRSRKRKAS